MVLGDPGAGKTTLLRYIARSLARDDVASPMPIEGAIPVFVRLGEYQDHCEKQGPVSLMDYLPIAAAVRELDLSPELLAIEAAQGRCVFLLDGLDEIVNTGRRREIRDRVEEFASRYATCRVVVTSHIVGYRDAQLRRESDGFEHFTLCPFGPQEIARFADHWFAAIRVAGTPTDPRLQNAESLTQGISANPSVKRLATNPLLMTLIALLYWRKCRLPRRRIELYRGASELRPVEVGAGRDPQLEVSERETTSLLMAVAFRMHATSSSGLISAPELEEVLIEQLTDPRRTGLGELPRTSGWSRSCKPWASMSGSSTSAATTIRTRRSSASCI